VIGYVRMIARKNIRIDKRVITKATTISGAKPAATTGQPVAVSSEQDALSPIEDASPSSKMIKYYNKIILSLAEITAHPVLLIHGLTGCAFHCFNALITTR
jgi:hypothetical protein